MDAGRPYVPRMPVSLGWELMQTGATPGIVLDPFCGTGTVGEVALKLGRTFIGVDLYQDYVEIAQKRCTATLRYVEERYGYDRVYEMISIDQSDDFHFASEEGGASTLPGQVDFEELIL